MPPTETNPPRRWLMCAPRFFDVVYEINPWMNRAVKPEANLAAEQWQNLRRLMIELAPEVHFVEPQEGLPDMVFTANGALVHGKKAIISTFRHPERQGETPFFQQWFEQQGYETALLEGHLFEGEGDALFAGETLFVGHGFRSGPEVCPLISEILGLENVVPCAMVDPRFYHLDTCFAPISPSVALTYRPAFTPETVVGMERRLELIDVPEAEAAKFACNSVVLGKNVLIPAGCPFTSAALEGHGYKPYEVELSEFLKAGGAAKCLTLQI